jgi:hypothetical protein
MQAPEHNTGHPIAPLPFDHCDILAEGDESVASSGPALLAHRELASTGRDVVIDEGASNCSMGRPVVLTPCVARS